jgi:uncharacterized protein (DUF58 family)
MIVPSNRLLVWVALIVLPFTFLAALVPAAGAISLVMIGAFSVMAVADAIRATSALRGIAVLAAPVVRMSKDREARIELRIRNQALKAGKIRVGLALPPEIQSDQGDLDVVLPKGAELSALDWPCWPRKRGKYIVESVYLERASSLGFWSWRSKAPLSSELRVYPNLLTERKSLAAVFLNRGGPGLHAQRQVGKGREFEKLREYIPGDGYDEVHWKATAKRGRPVTKVFQVERTQEVYVIIDASRLSSRTVPDLQKSGAPLSQTQPSALTDAHVVSATTILERFITAALVLGLAAEQQGDLFGLLTFTDQVRSFVRAKTGKTHFNSCRDSLYTLQPEIVTPDYDELCTFIRLRLRRRALLVFLTSLDDALLAESFVRNMELLSRQHLVLVNMIQPPSVAPVFTNPQVSSLDDLYGHLGGHLLWHKLRELEKVLQRRGVRFSLLKNERLSSELVSQYMTVKQRQMI